MTTPQALSNTSERLLEFPQLRELLTAYASSPLGRGKIAALAPSRDREWIEHQQQLSEELRGYLQAGSSFDFHGLADPTLLVQKSRIKGAALELAEIREVLYLAGRASEWRSAANSPPATIHDKWQAVTELSANIADFSRLLQYFENKILPDGTLDDRASPELAHIRREIERQRRTIRESLQSYLRKLSDDGAVQDELISVRGDRFVIPVKIEQRRRVQGVTHGASSSGRTVFIEPLETIEQNNELVRLFEEEQAEIHRILADMTAQIGSEAEALLAAVDVLAEFELQFAKARFARDYDCVGVNLLNEGVGTVLILRKARHPLLERNLKPKRVAVVPLTVELEGDKRQLIITGPNTGGKTVALKTIGLLSLMAQAGIPVPADRAELPIFDGVYADIGDYQSIEQNLSTFSAHVTNIDFISHVATNRSLVLLDELGSATDPEEGAALAVSIADFFRGLGCLSIVSTHHTSLKVYAANTEGVLNAAVGFDECTLAPTYDLRLGVPGASAGINIAQRIGLHPQIISVARNKLSSQTQDVSRFLDRLHTQLRELDTERSGLRAREQEIARERTHLAQEGKKEQRDKVRELEKKLDSLLHSFEFQARETVNAVQDRAQALKLSKDAERRIAKLRREFREQFDAAVVAHTTGSDIGDKCARPHIVQSVSVGDSVRLRSLGREAKVLRHFDDDSFEVAVGPMKMKVPREDVASVVAAANANPVEAARSRGIGVSLSREDDTVPTEINVIGQTADEATSAVEKFLDRAFLAGLARVRIVHGSGMGILRRAIRQYLKNHPHVAGVSEPPQNEGGGGATVVDLRT